MEQKIYYFNEFFKELDCEGNWGVFSTMLKTPKIMKFVVCRYIFVVSYFKI